MEVRTKSQPWELSHDEFISYCESNPAFAQKWERAYGSFAIYNWMTYIQDAVKRGTNVPAKVREEAMVRK